MTIACFTGMQRRRRAAARRHGDLRAHDGASVGGDRREALHTLRAVGAALSAPLAQSCVHIIDKLVTASKLARLCFNQWVLHTLYKLRPLVPFDQ